MDRSILTLYSKSANKYPGEGAGEYLALEDEECFSQLNEIPNWRHMLSNFWVAPFQLDGLWWNSVEHAYQASKFRESNYEFYYEFSLDSESRICESPLFAKGAGGKTGKVQGKIYRPKNIQMDEGYFQEKRDEIEMQKAQEAKFLQHPELMKMLKLTGNAQLFHYLGRGQGNIRFTYLEELRDRQ